MIGLIPILLLGTLILVFCGRLLLQWSRSRHAQPVTIEDFVRARAALDSMSLEAMATRRIFAIDDMEFIAGKGALDQTHDQLCVFCRCLERPVDVGVAARSF